MNHRKATRVLAVALILFAIYVTYTMVQRRDADRQSACIRQLMQIEGAKEQYALEHEGGAPASIDALVPRYLKTVPACPSGGSYVLGDMQTNVVCSEISHAWEPR